MHVNLPALARLSFWRARRLPVILQTETTECGLAVVCMIASFWGHRVDLPAMRKRFPVSLKGVTLRNIMNFGSSLGFQSRPLKLDIKDLIHLKLPCILHWDFNHFVVLKSISHGMIVIHDPKSGARRLRWSEVSKHFTGVALELFPSETFKTRRKVPNYSLQSLIGNVVGLHRSLANVLLLGLALQVCMLIGPFYLQWLVDEALLAGDKDLVSVLGCGFVLLIILQTTISTVRAWAITVLATNLNFQWLNNAFSHLLRLPLPFFEKRHAGDIASRFGSIHTIQQGLTHQLVEGIIDIILIIGTGVMLAVYSPFLAGIACIAVTVYIVLRWTIFSSLKQATTEQIIHAANQETHLYETIRGVQSIRLFDRSDERRGAWMNTVVDQFNAGIRVAKISLSYETANALIFGIERVIIIWLAGVLVLDNKFSVGMLFSFISYKDQFSGRTASLVDKIFELKMLRLHGDRVADIIMTEAEESQPAHIGMSKSDPPCIEFRNVGFRYAEGEARVVEGFSLHIPPGQFVALTGTSGGGKTTLIKLLLGLLEPTEGEILVDGVPIQQLGLSNYRRLLGSVMQDDVLFAGSIADNISFFDTAADQGRIYESARLAMIDTEIRKMPMGYHTLVGDLGSGLSGGQKQRILLARALYGQPKLLILDEATSHLDVHNERAVGVAISTFPLTRVVVAHRPETIAKAQRIVVLDNGAIVNDFIPQS